MKRQFEASFATSTNIVTCTITSNRRLTLSTLKTGKLLAEMLRAHGKTEEAGIASACVGCEMINF